MSYISRAGIIAAGQGLRLKSLSPELTKPMIPIKGTPLIGWTAATLRDVGIRRITVILNSSGGPVRSYLKSRFTDIAWTFLMKNTDSSWESFRISCGLLSRDPSPFVVSTVDAVMTAEDALQFADVAGRALRPQNGISFDMALALTPFVDDEKPLWADVGSDRRITALGDDARQRKLVTAGLYAMSPDIAYWLPPAHAHENLRGFLTSAARQNRNILGIPLAQTIDVDRPEDLAAAEAFLSKRAGP